MDSDSTEASQTGMSEAAAAEEAARIQALNAESITRGQEMGYPHAEMLAVIDGCTNPRIELEGRPDYISALGLSPEGSPPTLRAEYASRAAKIVELPSEDQDVEARKLRDELGGADMVVEFGALGSYASFKHRWESSIPPDVKMRPEAEARALIGAEKEAFGLGFTALGAGLLQEVAERLGVDPAKFAKSQEAYIKSASNELVDRYLDAKAARQKLEHRRRQGENISPDMWNEPGRTISGLENAIGVLSEYLPSWGMADIADSLKSTIRGQAAEVTPTEPEGPDPEPGPVEGGAAAEAPRAAEVGTGNEDLLQRTLEALLAQSTRAEEKDRLEADAAEKARLEEEKKTKEEIDASQEEALKEDVERARDKIDASQEEAIKEDVERIREEVKCVTDELDVVFREEETGDGEIIGAKTIGEIKGVLGRYIKIVGLAVKALEAHKEAGAMALARECQTELDYVKGICTSIEGVENDYRLLEKMPVNDGKPENGKKNKYCEKATVERVLGERIEAIKEQERQAEELLRSELVGAAGIAEVEAALTSFYKKFGNEAGDEIKGAGTRKDVEKVVKLIPRIKNHNLLLQDVPEKYGERAAIARALGIAMEKADPRCRYVHFNDSEDKFFGYPISDVTSGSVVTFVVATLDGDGKYKYENKAYDRSQLKEHY